MPFLSPLSRRTKTEPIKQCTMLSRHGALYQVIVDSPLSFSFPLKTSGLFFSNLHDYVFPNLGVVQLLTVLNGPAQLLLDLSLPVTFGRRSCMSQVWEKIKQHQGETFYTAHRKAFTYKIEGEVLRHTLCTETLSCTSFEKAELLAPCKVSDIHDVVTGPSYVYAIITDPRIT